MLANKQLDLTFTWHFVDVVNGKNYRVLYFAFIMLFIVLYKETLNVCTWIIRAYQP